MYLEPVTKIDQIKKGDQLLISDGKKIIQAVAKFVQVTDIDGTEVIFNVRYNKFFNLGMYLEGLSWAKDVQIIRL